MVLTDGEKREVVNVLIKKFALFDCITEEYIEGFVNAYVNGDGHYDGFDFGNEDCPLDTNPYLFVSFKIQSFIYLKLCRLANEDADILLMLVEDRRKIVNMIGRKLNFTDETKKEDYLIDALLSFNGEESLDTFITRYVMAKIRGVPFVLKEKNIVVKQEQEIPSKGKGKKNKKKIKNVALKPTRIDNSLSYDIDLKGLNGSLVKDEFVNKVLDTGILDLIDYEIDKRFTIYILLRFGLLNGTYYSLEDIGTILGDSKLGLSFEKKMIDLLSKEVNFGADEAMKLQKSNK